MNALYSVITQLRLRAQQLRGTHLENAHDMVKWFGAVQAQEYALTKWGIGLRNQNRLQNRD
jgi:hypothetical protein